MVLDVKGGSSGTGAGLTTAMVRTLHASVDVRGSRVEAVARSLGEAIRLGVVHDGQRLPPEVQLAELFGVSAVTMREALAVLREQGLIATRRGRGGGTVVRVPVDTREPLHGFSIQDLRDLGDHRSAVSGTAASLAAERGLPDEVRRLEDCVRRLREARTPGDWRRADGELAIAIATTAQSPRLAREEALLLAEVGDLVALDLEPDDLDDLSDRRAEVVRAVGDRLPDRARALAEAYVRRQTERLVRERLRLAPRTAVPPVAGDAVTDRLAGVVADVDAVVTDLEHLGRQYADTVRAAAERPSREALAGLRPAIAELLGRHDPLLKGAGVVVASGLLSDAALWLEWWWRTSRGDTEALRVNLDPSAPDYHDYTTSEYYAAAGRSRLPYATGPYVDFACTNEYTITVVSPVWSQGRFLGAAGADILVAALERLVMPALTSVDRPLALTSHGGRVIAANVPHVLPGQCIDVPPGSRAAAPSSRLWTWLLVDL
ncbi:MAG: GntR family transcriptional regulator [Actinobacteria bacterium]|nr:GntR family transcriptional regulator [Actinomycetota bacterium]